MPWLRRRSWLMGEAAEGQARGAGARSHVERGRAPGGRPGAAQGAGPVPMSGNDRARYVALSGGIGGAKLSLGLAQLLGRAADGHRQHRRRLRASGPLRLARRRHHALHAGRRGQHRDRLGPRGRDLELHAGDGGARRPDLVQARRPRSRDACGAHAAPRGRRDADRHHPASGGEARHCRAHPADG